MLKLKQEIMEFKGTKGEWQVDYYEEITTGVSSTLFEKKAGKYSKVIVENILPLTDEDWEEEKEETISNLKLIAAAPITTNCLIKSNDLLQEAIDCVHTNSKENVYLVNLIKEQIDFNNKAIEKALK